jgi:hypothetical protein
MLLYGGREGVQLKIGCCYNIWAGIKGCMCVCLLLGGGCMAWVRLWVLSQGGGGLRVGSGISPLPLPPNPANPQEKIQ